MMVSVYGRGFASAINFSNDLRSVVFDIVQKLARDEKLFHPDFWEALAEERPRQREKITSVHAEFLAKNNFTRLTDASLRDYLRIFGDGSRLDAGKILAAIPSQDYVPGTPAELARELAQRFPKLSHVEYIVDAAAELLHRAFPRFVAASSADIAAASAREAWDSLLRESRKMSPQAFAAVLLAAQSELDTPVELILVTLRSLHLSGIVE